MVFFLIIHNTERYCSSKKWNGVTVSYKPHDKLYHVKYNDGDSEDLSEDEAIESLYNNTD